eukprot:TRINITY_DN24607_c0_g1_i1.p1 TRINITY_DN24607_c0_g1~~TRINITY_DN24607_c0_g1_i1.p1  ORF type:complete len:710 (+),score=144.78 TRINITY_DN24607_c0_g1_i1:1776-3905(+)
MLAPHIDNAAGDLDPSYPVGEHFSERRMLGWFISIFFATVNALAMILAYARRPPREAKDMNLLIHWVLFGELVAIGLSFAHLVWESFMRGAGVLGLLNALPGRVLGTHMLVLVPLGWIPQRWLRRMRRIWNFAHEFAVRPKAVEFGLVLAGISAAFLFISVPLVCILAKIAFLDHELHDRALDSVTILFGVAVAGNVRDMVAIVLQRPVHELRLPRSLWEELMQRLRGPEDSSWKQSLLHAGSLVSFPGAVRRTHVEDLPLLYEVVVLNGGSLIPKGGDDPGSGGSMVDIAAGPLPPGPERQGSAEGDGQETDPAEQTTRTTAAMMATSTSTQAASLQASTLQAATLVAGALHSSDSPSKQARGAARQQVASSEDSLMEKMAELEPKVVDLRLQCQRLRQQVRTFESQSTRAGGHPLLEAAQQARQQPWGSLAESAASSVRALIKMCNEVVDSRPSQGVRNPHARRRLEAALGRKEYPSIHQPLPFTELPPLPNLQPAARIRGRNAHLRPGSTEVPDAGTSWHGRLRQLKALQWAAERNRERACKSSPVVSPRRERSPSPEAGRADSPVGACWWGDGRRKSSDGEQPPLSDRLPSLPPPPVSDAEVEDGRASNILAEPVHKRSLRALAEFATRAAESARRRHTDPSDSEDALAAANAGIENAGKALAAAASRRAQAPKSPISPNPLEAFSGAAIDSASPSYGDTFFRDM